MTVRGFYPRLPAPISPLPGNSAPRLHAAVRAARQSRGLPPLPPRLATIRASFVHDPYHRDTERPRRRHEAIDAVGNFERLEIRAGPCELLHSLAINRYNDDRAAIGKARDFRRWQSIDKEERVELAAQHQFRGRLRIVVEEGHGSAAQSMYRKHWKRCLTRARTGCADGNALALEVRDGSDIRVAACDEIERLAIDAGDRAEIADRLLTAEGRFRARCKIENGRGDERGIVVARAHRTDIRHRTGRGLRHRDEARDATRQAALAARRARRTADRRCQPLADGEIFVARTTRSDLKKGHRFRGLLQARWRPQVEQEHESGGDPDTDRHGQVARRDSGCDFTPPLSHPRCPLFPMPNFHKPTPARQCGTKMAGGQHKSANSVQSYN